MQDKRQTILLGFLSISLLVIMSFTLLDNNMESKDKKVKTAVYQEKGVTGAWKLESTEAADAAKMEVIRIITKTYYSDASYDGKKFIGTGGGTYTLSNNTFTENREYFTWDSTKVGTSNSFSIKLNNNKMTLSGDRDGKPFKEQWVRLATKENTPLTGTWRIRERQREPGQMNVMEWGPRKTLKILSGNRFQWIAYNVETKEFSGTGGGTYTAKNGKYEETLEFFSRDPERVGAKLSFNFEVKGNQWHHKGKSSAGSDIYEVWEKVD